MRALSRQSFMALAGAISAAVAPARALAQTAGAPPPARSALAQALVLSGGGALGAYEAGIVESLVAAGNVGEGEPLRPYGIVCGTSIGALNAYFVATGQYAKLRSLWSTIAAQNVVRLKPEYAKINNESSGVGTRFAQQFSLLQGLRGNVTGVIDGDHLRAWMLDYFDFSRPIVMPMFWAVTNLTMERPEYFYLAPAKATAQDKALALASVRLALGADVPVREATPALLVDQLRASAAVPVGFDPVALPSPEGPDHLYVDGGVTANTPIRIATALALRVDVVLLNPAFEAAKIRNAVDVAAGSFDTMQRKLMENALRSAYVESFALQALRDLPATYTQEVARRSGIPAEQLATLQRALYQTELYGLRPQKALPVNLLGFQDGEALAQTYALGKADGATGFQRYDPQARAVVRNG